MKARIGYKKIFVLVTLFQFILLHGLEARILETPAQIAKRYGPPLKHNEKIFVMGVDDVRGDTYEKNGVDISVVYQDGRAVYLAFEKGTVEENGVGLGTWEEESVKLLPEANTEGRPWTKIATSQMDKYIHYSCTELNPEANHFVELTATWTRIPGYPSKVVIETLEYQQYLIEQNHRQHEDENNKQLKGF